jgi:hypothetical protein
VEINDTHSTTTSFYEPEVINKGDVNNDQRVTVSDAILLARIVAEDSSLKVNSQMLAAADYDKDGSITPLDTTALLKVLAGIA